MGCMAFSVGSAVTEFMGERGVRCFQRGESLIQA